jgi:hypothetical protein
MENQAVVISVVGGGIIALLSGLLKGPLQRFNTQVVVVIISLLVGVGYYAFQVYVPGALQESILTFFWGSMTASVFIYEFLWKNVKKVPAALGFGKK